MVAEFVELVDKGIRRSSAATRDRRARGSILLDEFREVRKQTVGDGDFVGRRLLIREATSHVEPFYFTRDVCAAKVEQVAIPADGGGNRISVVLALTLPQFGVLCLPIATRPHRLANCAPADWTSR